MSDKLITIMTPSYNRANLLPRLYKSIVEQATDDIEWLIVDDGSVDNTEEVVKEFIAENKVDITYIKQENVGKYKAFDTGVDNASGKLYFCVDSDDMLAPYAIEHIKEAWKVIENQDFVAGVVALKNDLNGKRIASADLPYGEYTLYDISNKLHISGDLSLIFKTEILKEYRFPDVYPETFVTECVLFDKIDQKYKLFTVNRVVNICEYQANGLSDSVVKIMLKNPTGYKLYHMQRIDMALDIKTRIMHVVKYHAFSMLSKDNQYRYNGKHKLLVRIMYPLGFIAKHIYINKGKKQ